jgi:hypothetical protein
MSDPGIALDVRLAKDRDVRRYCLQQCAKLPGWSSRWIAGALGRLDRIVVAAHQHYQVR